MKKFLTGAGACDKIPNCAGTCVPVCPCILVRQTGGISLLSQLRCRKKVTGVKQSARAVRDGSAQLVFLARDADPALIARVREQCRSQGVEVAEGFTMRELGQAAGIQVGAAVAAVLKN